MVTVNCTIWPRVTEIIGLIVCEVKEFSLAPLNWLSVGTHLAQALGLCNAVPE